MRDDLKNQQNKEVGTLSGDEMKVVRVDLTRRKFSRATMATPIVGVLISRPLWGATCTPTGFLSGNLSENHNHVDECSAASGTGCMSIFWKFNVQAWATTPYSAGVRVNHSNGKVIQWDVSSATTWDSAFGFSSSLGSGASLLQVLHDSSSVLEVEAVAALLNAADDPSGYGMSTAEVIGIVQAVAGPNPEKAGAAEDLFLDKNVDDCGGSACADGEVFHSEAHTPLQGCVPIVGGIA